MPRVTGTFVACEIASQVRRVASQVRRVASQVRQDTCSGGRAQNSTRAAYRTEVSRIMAPASKTSKASYPEILAELERVRQLFSYECKVDLPEIVVVGAQSAGKSSLLGSIVDGLIEVLPQGTGTVTRMCAVVRFSNDKGYEPRLSVQCRAAGYSEREFKWDATGRGDANQHIREIQAKVLEGEKDGFSNEEVIIDLRHPDVQNLVLVDTPGLVADNPEARALTEELVKKRISKTTALIVVAKPAEEDEQNVAATSLARQADPRGERTLTVETKFDSFSSEANQKHAYSRMLRERDSELARHAVICRPKGIHDLDFDTVQKLETDSFKKIAIDAFWSEPAPRELLGSQALVRERLPGLLATRVRDNVPKVLGEIRTRIAQAQEKLREFGEQPRSAQDWILALQASVKKQLAAPFGGAASHLEESLAPALETLQEESFAAVMPPSEQAVSEAYRPNAHLCPLFNGHDALLKLANAQAERFWSPSLQAWAKKQRATVEECLCLPHDPWDVRMLPSNLVSAYNDTCRTFVEEKVAPVFSSFARSSAAKLTSRWATKNHYFDAEFHQEMTLPTDLVEAFISNVLAESTGNDYVDLEDLLRDNFATLKHRIERLKKATLDERQCETIRRATHAYLKVQQKSLVDDALQAEREVLDLVAQFVEHDILLDKRIHAHASEEGAVTEIRKVAKHEIEVMEQAKEILAGLVARL